MSGKVNIQTTVANGELLRLSGGSIVGITPEALAALLDGAGIPYPETEGTLGQVLGVVDAAPFTVGWIDAGAGEGTVTGVNGQTPVDGEVTLDPDDLDDTSTAHKFATAAELSKLAGIEAGAEVNDSAAEVLAKLVTVDGTGSGLDADTLDGSQATAFATAAQGTLADTALQPDDVGTAAAEDVGAFATAAQGALADSATQPGDLAPVATSGDYDDLTNTPAFGTAAAADTDDFATADDTPIEILWVIGTGWRLRDGTTGWPTDGSRTLSYNSQNDPSATTPTAYSEYDEWKGRTA